MKYRDTSEDLYLPQKDGLSSLTVEEKELKGEDFVSFKIDGFVTYIDLKQVQDLTEKLQQFIQKTARKQYEKEFK